MNRIKQTVSLVLGSGGARGLARIGVIQVLEEQGFVIESISDSNKDAGKQQLKSARQWKGIP